MKSRTTFQRQLLASALLLALAAGFFFSVPAALAGVLAQHPTVSIPTVTGTRSGPKITVPIDQSIIYVHSGPGLSFPIIGILVSGEVAPALAATADQEWIQIVYYGVPGSSGWIFGRLISLSSGSLPEVTPPPTPTPKFTATLDPTLAARFIVEEEPTRLPTYTPAAPVVLATYVPAETTTAGGALPIGFIIIGLAVVGAFGVLLSILRGR